MKTNNISKHCTHNGVSIEFSYYNEPEEGTRQGFFTAQQHATVDGRPISSTDRYDLEGNRISEKRVWDRIFTEEYYEALDNEAKKFSYAI